MERNIETFIGCDADYEDAKIVLFGAPFDSFQILSSLSFYKTKIFPPESSIFPTSFRRELLKFNSISPFAFRCVHCFIRLLIQ